MRKIVINKKTLKFQNKKIYCSELKIAKEINIFKDEFAELKAYVGINSDKYSINEKITVSNETASVISTITKIENGFLYLNVPIFSNIPYIKIEKKDSNIYVLISNKTNVNNITLMKNYKAKLNKNDELLDYVILDEGNDNTSVMVKDVFNGWPTNNFIYLPNNFLFKDLNSLNDDVYLSRMEKYFEFQIPIDTNNAYKISDDDNHMKELSNNIKDSIIPDIVNNEKQQFIPCFKRGNDYIPISELEFNFHFRDRMEGNKLNEEWATDDSKGWNCYKLNGSKTNEYIEPILGDDVSDSLNYLGFTEDDIRFQKKKVKKSFLRLMFYSDRNPLSQELLFYSTIFIDSGKAYSTYNKLKALNKEIFNDYADEDDRLSSRITVNSKYNLDKSSEGFYLYLFPSEIGSENKEKTIYMKAEFNHAGYGKTIPLMIPTDSNENVISSESKNFPCNFIKVDGDGMSTDLEKYYSSIMIPLTIRYDEKLKKYIYFFSTSMVDATENKIKFNFFEPRIKWKE